MHPALLGHATAQSRSLHAFHSHFFGPSSYPIQVQETRNIALLMSNRVAFDLTEGLIVLLEVESDARSALVEKQAEHVWKRRPREAREIVLALPGVISRIKYLGRIPGEHHPTRIVVGATEDSKFLLCIVKFVSAAKARSGADEAWLKTAYFADAKEISRLLGRRVIRPLRSDA